LIGDAFVGDLLDGDFLGDAFLEGDLLDGDFLGDAFLAVVVDLVLDRVPPRLPVTISLIVKFYGYFI
jgi:hypothetical protein